VDEVGRVAGAYGGLLALIAAHREQDHVLDRLVGRVLRGDVFLVEDRLRRQPSAGVGFLQVLALEGADRLDRVVDVLGIGGDDGFGDDAVEDLVRVGLDEIDKDGPGRVLSGQVRIGVILREEAVEDEGLTPRSADGFSSKPGIKVFEPTFKS
jgi:hypothetical protein